MTKRVVDFFEAIKVDNEECEARLVATRLVDRECQSTVQQGTVRQIGERVVHRPVRQHLLYSLAVGDVVENANHTVWSTLGITPRSIRGYIPARVTGVWDVVGQVTGFDDSPVERARQQFQATRSSQIGEPFDGKRPNHFRRGPTRHAFHKWIPHHIAQVPIVDDDTLASIRDHFLNEPVGRPNSMLRLPCAP